MISVELRRWPPSGMQGGPVGEFLGVAVERPALDQLQVEVGRTAEDRLLSGLSGDHGAAAYLRTARDVEVVDCSDLADGLDRDEQSS